jgi:hypothetical protein
MTWTKDKLVKAQMDGHIQYLKMALRGEVGGDTGGEVIRGKIKKRVKGERYESWSIAKGGHKRGMIVNNWMPLSPLG